MYSGLRDPTRVNKKAIAVEEIEARLKHITIEHDDVRVSRVVKPFNCDHLPPELNSFILT